MRIARFAILMTLLLTLPLPAQASFAPIKFKSTRERVAQICADLGPRASLTAWRYENDQYGCVDTETGNVLVCESDGSCTLYFGPGTVVASLSRQA